MAYRECSIVLILISTHFNLGGCLNGTDFIAWFHTWHVNMAYRQSTIQAILRRTHSNLGGVFQKHHWTNRWHITIYYTSLILDNASTQLWIVFLPKRVNMLDSWPFLTRQSSKLDFFNQLEVLKAIPFIFYVFLNSDRIKDFFVGITMNQWYAILLFAGDSN